MLKTEKGITLIALIITIIVMLILVGVTINVALNGGLFTKAEYATKQTQMEAEKEELLSAVVAAIGTDGKVDFNYLDSNLPKDWEGTNGTYKSPKENTYTVDEYGKITEGNLSGGGNSSVESEEDLRKYILGADGKGRNFDDILDDGDAFLQDPEDTSSTIHEKIKQAYTEYDEYDTYYIRYNREVYKFKYEKIGDSSSEFYGQTRTVEGSLEKVSTAEGNLGKYVEYAGNTWIVLRDNASGVELITANATEERVRLGEANYENGRISYNNAVETLIQESKDICKEEYGIEISGNVLGIRCVGGPATDETSSTETVDFTNLTNFKPHSGFPYENFAGTTEEKGLKIGDDKYLEDYNQMKKIGILCSDNRYDYWLASRSAGGGTSEFSFNIREVVNGDRSGSTLIVVFASGGTPWTYDTLGNTLRPVITLTPGILKNATETGTIDDPIILN